jgi:hypothetical protein
MEAEIVFSFQLPDDGPRTTDNGQARPREGDRHPLLRASAQTEPVPGAANNGQYKADLRREAAVIRHPLNGFAIPESRLLGVGPTSRAFA